MPRRSPTAISRGSRLICVARAQNPRIGATSKGRFPPSASSRRHRTDEGENRSYATMTTFDLNGRTVSAHGADDTPLLWVIRDEMGLTGTKFGCGIGLCGACTVHVEGRATRSCITAVGEVAG